MWRERALTIRLALLGLFFVAGIYPLITLVRSAWQANNEDATPMMFSLYVALGIFLLMAVPEPIGTSQPNRLHGMVELCSRIRWPTEILNPAETECRI